MKRMKGLVWLGAASLALALVGCGGGSGGNNNNGGGAVQGPLTFAVNSNNELITFQADRPNQPSQPTAITGLQGGERILGIDVRPADGTLYALGSSSRLYRINTTSGAATAVGGQFAIPLRGTTFGFDFNPTVDRIRIVSDTDQNLRANPGTGAIVDGDMNAANGVTEDGTLAYVGGDVAQGQNPNIAAVAYANNVAGALTTTLFAIDTTRNTLVKFDSANAGTLRTVGSLGVDPSSVASFDIQGGTDDAYAVLRVNGEAALYKINGTTGAATRVNRVDTGTSNIVALAVAP
ncbi:MAG TPA: DUF4394 domain-containing protein [Abditibacteriaceae bacterium]|jgi:hypothetical protein